MRTLFIACAALMAASCGAREEAAPQAASAPIVLTEAWASPTPQGVTVSAGYVTIENTQAAPDALVAIESTRAGRAEIHEMIMEDGVMRMNAVERLEIPAGASVTLGPGARHLMFYDVATPFTAGEDIDVRLTFANAGVVETTLPVRARNEEHSGGH